MIVPLRSAFSLAMVAAWVSLIPVATGEGLRFQHHYIAHDLPVNARGYGDYGLAALVDIDRDGDLDFVFGGRASLPSKLYWFEYQGPDHWVQHLVGTEYLSDVELAAVDVDRDGWADLVCSGVWYRNPGRPREQPFERLVFAGDAGGAHDVLAADIDGDGRQDIVMMGDPGTQLKELVWFRIPDDPRQLWERHRIGPSVHGAISPAGVADLDGDGDLDVVRADTWFENLDGKGLRWQAHSNIPMGRKGPFGVCVRTVVTDVDGDGKQELVMCDADIEDSKVAILKNVDGKGRQWSKREIPLSFPCGSLHSLDVADFNGDGRKDILVCEQEELLPAGRQNPRFVVLENMGDRFVERVIFDGRLGGHEVAVGDVDGDGDLDICSKAWGPLPWNANRGRMHADYLENLFVHKGTEKASANSGPSTSPVGSALRMGPGGRHLVDAKGRPLFWLGDTAWLLFQKATHEDAELYLATRARQGFTVIQAALVMGEERVGGTLLPNRYGDPAFSGGNPAHALVTPGHDPSHAEQYDYWDHVDYIIDRSAAHGLTMGLLPLFVGYRGDGYKYLTPDSAYNYGLFLGQRYRHKPHLLWILGGDNTPDTEAKQRVWHEMARGITVGVAGKEDYDRTLMTYHINGNGSSSAWFHKAPWLDFNMIQVWGSEKAIYPTIAGDYGLTPVKPTGLGEGSYEDGPQYPTRPINAHKIRKQAYWSYFSGGYHTYGNTNTWNFSSYKQEGTQDWKTALESAGAARLSVLARIFHSIEWWNMVPDPSTLASGSGGGETRNCAMRSLAGDRLIVYLSSPATVSLRLNRLSAVKTASATWIDPQTGARTIIGDFPTTGVRSFSTPRDWLDALLLLEGKQ